MSTWVNFETELRKFDPYQIHVFAQTPERVYFALTLKSF
ncbi:hypothetical protein ADICYQ_3271 [Cyclobacterium qasimii M12-11B]|uniref:Uncharacterized protein n=1 Tax=Cyclobacterium qasimii M12-11B TaxID=641524 RepID=S7VCC5_9BACT|nr:hypothetical protein ADICYQ_3271 [Cyclobacterium qasimii M12-11B]